jgi:formate hydrogenlyase subunit 4
MAGVNSRDAGVAGGLVNVAHHLGGAFCLGVLVTVFNAAGSPGDTPQVLLADRVSAALTAACLFLVTALAVTLVARPRRATNLDLVGIE